MRHGNRRLREIRPSPRAFHRRPPVRRPLPFVPGLGLQIATSHTSVRSFSARPPGPSAFSIAVRPPSARIVAASSESGTSSRSRPSDGRDQPMAAPAGDRPPPRPGGDAPHHALDALHAFEHPQRAVHRLTQLLARALHTRAPISIVRVNGRLGQRPMLLSRFPDHRVTHVG